MPPGFLISEGAFSRFSFKRRVKPSLRRLCGADMKRLSARQPEPLE